jgi:hypothetical protein
MYLTAGALLIEVGYRPLPAMRAASGFPPQDNARAVGHPGWTAVSEVQDLLPRIKQQRYMCTIFICAWLLQRVKFLVADGRAAERAMSMT